MQRHTDTTKAIPASFTVAGTQVAYQIYIYIIQIYIFLSSMSIGLARGCSGCRGTPRAKKNIWGVIYRGKLQVHYPGTARSQIF